jgi:hypothetical protein
MFVGQNSVLAVKNERNQKVCRIMNVIVASLVQVFSINGNTIYFWEMFTNYG